MSNIELLSAISDLLNEKLEEKLEAKFEEKLAPIYQRLDRVEQHSHTTRMLLENAVLPLLQNIEACYTETAKCYLDRVQQIDTLASDVDVLKRVVHTHSCVLQTLPILTN